MKKQLRLVLFAVLVMVLIVASALVASAVTEGSVEPENGHYYQVHTGPRDRQPKYYSTLEKAIASIEADGSKTAIITIEDSFGGCVIFWRMLCRMTLFPY